jgi:hypothetical protein
VLIPVAELEGRLGELDPNAPTLVHCQTGQPGGRSEQAAAILDGNGFAEVYEMDGGIEAWIAEGYPVVTGGSSGGCFIATAAYGSSMDAHVDMLRGFRDSHLETNQAGSAFVSLYYKASPPLAEFIDDHPALKPAVRLGLFPAVAVSSAATGTPLFAKATIAASLILVSAVMAAWAIRRRGCAECS